MMNLKELNAGGGKVEILVPNLKKKNKTCLAGRDFMEFEQLISHFN